MCLYIDKFLTQQELQEKIVPIRLFHKLFLKRKGFLESPYHYFKVSGPGVITHSDPADPVMALKQVGIESGIFNARVTPEATKQDRFWAEYFAKGEYTCVCVPVLVKQKDIIAFGIQDDVGVTAYEITQEQWGIVFK